MKKMMVLVLLAFSFVVHAQSHGGGHSQYRDVFHYLLQNHVDIEREVSMIDNGIKTLTTSEQPDVARHIKKHVMQMKGLIESGRPIRRWDPLFAAIFEHYKLIEMKVSIVENGVIVIETSHDPFVAKLIQEHAKVVSLFVRNGFEEAQRSHEVPRN